LDTIRVFLAVKVPEEFKEKIQEVQKQLKMQNADVGWVGPENFHYNLKFFGYVTEPEIKKIESAVKRVVAGHHPFKLEIEGIGTFPTPTAPRVIWLGTKKGTAEITALANDLDKEFSKEGFESENRPFTAHLTLGRVKSTQNKQKLVEKVKDLKAMKIGEFNIEEITLFQSQLQREGPIYTELMKFRLKEK
jgi:2'-5' RNA ligase